MREQNGAAVTPVLDLVGEPCHFGFFEVSGDSPFGLVVVVTGVDREKLPRVVAQAEVAGRLTQFVEQPVVRRAAGEQVVISTERVNRDLGEVQAYPQEVVE